MRPPDVLPAPVSATVPASLAPLLRRAVRDHVSAERRRAFAPVLRVGRPGGRVSSLLLDAPLLGAGGRLDHALGVDVLEAMLRRVEAGPERLVWLTRPGTLEVQDIDLGWASVTRAAGSELGVALPMVVVTRQGWRDPTTGEGRTWRRMRPVRPLQPGCEGCERDGEA